MVKLNKFYKMRGLTDDKHVNINPSPISDDIPSKIKIYIYI